MDAYFPFFVLSIVVNIVLGVKITRLAKSVALVKYWFFRIQFNVVYILGSIHPSHFQ